MITKFREDVEEIFEVVKKSKKFILTNVKEGSAIVLSYHGPNDYSLTDNEGKNIRRGKKKQIGWEVEKRTNQI